MCLPIRIAVSTSRDQYKPACVSIFNVDTGVCEWTYVYEPCNDDFVNSYLDISIHCLQMSLDRLAIVGCWSADGQHEGQDIVIVDLKQKTILKKFSGRMKFYDHIRLTEISENYLIGLSIQSDCSRTFDELSIWDFSTGKVVEHHRYRDIFNETTRSFLLDRSYDLALTQYQQAIQIQQTENTENNSELLEYVGKLTKYKYWTVSCMQPVVHDELVIYQIGVLVKESNGPVLVFFNIAKDKQANLHYQIVTKTTCQGYHPSDIQLISLSDGRFLLSGYGQLYLWTPYDQQLFLVTRFTSRPHNFHLIPPLKSEIDMLREIIFTVTNLTDPCSIILEYLKFSNICFSRDLWPQRFDNYATLN
jgi:hypothetical protein